MEYFRSYAAVGDLLALQLLVRGAMMYTLHQIEA